MSLPDPNWLEAMRGLAEQTLDDGYPFPREHRWWVEQAERHARSILALASALEKTEAQIEQLDKVVMEVALAIGAPFSVVPTGEPVAAPNNTERARPDYDPKVDPERYGDGPY